METLEELREENKRLREEVEKLREENEELRKHQDRRNYSNVGRNPKLTASDVANIEESVIKGEKFKDVCERYGISAGRLKTTYGITKHSILQKHKQTQAQVEPTAQEERQA